MPKPTKQRNCTPVNICTRSNGTLLKYGRSGWYFLGMKNKRILSKNWRPFNEATPINKNTPYNTGIGILFSSGTINTDSPTKIKMITCVTLCSLKNICSYSVAFINRLFLITRILRKTMWIIFYLLCSWQYM